MYYLLNFISYFFEDKKTLEFRCHHMTFDFEEIYHWLIICTSIIEFAKEYPDRCTNNYNKILLKNIITNPDTLEYIKEKKAINLLRYYNA